jgi:hypothetical protein
VCFGDVGRWSCQQPAGIALLLCENPIVYMMGKSSMVGAGSMTEMVPQEGLGVFHRVRRAEENVKIIYCEDLTKAEKWVYLQMVRG